MAACLLVVGSVFTAGCVQSAGSTTDRTPAESTVGAVETTTADRAGMESRLAGLVAADDRAAYAAEHGLDYGDGRVAVVVTLADGATFPEGHGAAVDLAHERTVQANVPVDELDSLAAHGNVTYVRLPREPSE